MINDINQIRLVDLKSLVHQHWSKLTVEDISRLNSGTESLIAILRIRYGYGKAQAEIEISKWLQEVNLHADESD